MNASLAANQTADDIVALINSRPTSPTKEEIAAVIIAKAAASSARDAYFVSAWRRALDRFVEEAARLADEDGSVADEQCEKINQDIIVASQAVWARPCENFDDLLLLAAVATFWNAPDSNDALCLLSRSGPDMAFDERSLAHVVRGILDLLGMKFDADGRLI